MDTTTLQRLADRADIQDVMLRYCRGVDRRDWELVRATFFVDARDDHAEFHGTRDEYVAWISERHDQPGVRKSTHFLGNSLIEFVTNEKAAVETYFMARLELGPDAGGHRDMLSATGNDSVAIEVLGRYIDRFEKRDGQWRVARRRTVFDSMNSRAVSGDARKPDWMLGTRTTEDPLHEVRREAGLAAMGVKS